MNWLYAYVLVLAGLIGGLILVAGTLALVFLAVVVTS